MMEKASIRKAVRAMYPGEAQRNAESTAICQQLMDWTGFQQAQCIGLYIPMKREADVTPLVRYCLTHGKKTVLPRVESDGVMTMRCIETLEQLKPGAYGIPEPAADAPVIDPEALELLIVPIEALRRDGLRLGKGGGYYDRFLLLTKCVTVGVVLSWQWVDELPQDAWDQPLNAAVDAKGFHWFAETSKK